MAIYIPGNGGGGTGTGSVTGDFYTKYQADSRFVHLSGLENINGQKTFLANTVFADSVAVSGNLTILGRISAVRTDASFIEVNANEVGSGVNNSSGGLIVNRGSLIPARLLFSENLSGNSDNRWYLQNGDGFTEKIIYDGIPDPVLINGVTTVNNDLIVYYDLKIPNQPNTGFLVTDGTGKIVNSGYNSNSFATVSYVSDISSGLQVQISSILHNGLSGIQGGLPNERYHLTQSQYDNYIGRTEVVGVSSVLNSKIISISGNYATISQVSNITGNLQTQINNLNTSVNNVTGQFATISLVSGTSGVLQGNINTKISDAPIDGKQYARKDGNWTEVTSVTGSSSSGSGFIPLAGIGITITPSGSNYSFSVNDYISKTQVSNVTGSLQAQINSFNIVAGSSNVSVIEGPLNTFTISASISGEGGSGVSVSGSKELGSGIIWQGYTYVSNIGSKTLSYDIDGNLVTLVSDIGSKLFNYDNSGTLINISGSGAYSSKVFIYDGNGNLSTIEVV